MGSIPAHPYKKVNVRSKNSVRYSFWVAMQRGKGWSWVEGLDVYNQEIAKGKSCFKNTANEYVRNR